MTDFGVIMRHFVNFTDNDVQIIIESCHIRN